MKLARAVMIVGVMAGCGDPVHHLGAVDGGRRDGGGDAGGGRDGGGGGGSDGGGAIDAGSGSGSGSGSGVITGGPCASGAAGATAFRIGWMGQEGGAASAVYEVDGLPDQSVDQADVFGFQIGFQPTFTDTFLGDGGVALDDSDFMDLQMSTVGVASISTATLAMFGRSFSVDAPGSFNWQTFDGTGSTDQSFVSNSVPYQWYAADMTTEISAGDGGVRIRIKAGPGSDSLIVNRIELCLQAN